MIRIFQPDYLALPVMHDIAIKGRDFPPEVADIRDMMKNQIAACSVNADMRAWLSYVVPNKQNVFIQWLAVSDRENERAILEEFMRALSISPTGDPVSFTIPWAEHELDRPTINHLIDMGFEHVETVPQANRAYGSLWDIYKFGKTYGQSEAACSGSC